MVRGGQETSESRGAGRLANQTVPGTRWFARRLRRSDASNLGGVTNERREPTAPPADSSPLIDRRKVLLALGFGATNVAALRGLGTTGASPGQPSDTSDPRAGPSTTVTVTSEPGDAVVSEPASIPGATAQTDPGHVFDVVISNGRVLDPQSGYDQVANVGIDGNQITAITTDRLTGAGAPIDATGRVVAPGFIDILSYEPNGYGEWFKLADGVTSNLSMHGIDNPMTAYLDKVESLTPPINYGGAYDNATIRSNAGVNIYDEAGSALDQIVGAAAADVAAGAIGLHLQPEYSPGAGFDEIAAHAPIATDADMPLFMHIRYSEDIPPGTQAEAIDEVVRVARETGARVHVEHINSTGGTNRMEAALATLDAARAEGLDITACVYPYTFWATFLQSTRYEDWQTKYNLTYGDLQVAGTSDRLTEATYQQAYDDNRLTAAFAMPESDLVTAFQSSWVMVGSDAILQTHHNNHPRSTGCFSRTLGTYVRDQNVMTLRQGLAKMTILPAQLLQAGAPSMRRKGRLQIGADADITIFDPATITDNSTIATPQRPSTGVDWVLVAGQIAKRPTGAATDAGGRALPEGVDTSVRAGKPILAGRE